MAAASSRPGTPRWSVSPPARADAIARPVDEVLIALPHGVWSQPLSLALAGERGTGPAVFAAPSEGAHVWLEPRWVLRADAPGAVLVLRDVTEDHKHALFMRALETVGRSLTSSLELDQVLDTIAEKTREAMGADAAMVASWDGRSEKLTILRAAGRLTADYAPGGFRSPAGPSAPPRRKVAR